MVSPVQDKLLTTGESAKELHVTSMTIRTWYYKGLLKAVRLPGGHLRVPASEVERLKCVVAEVSDE